MSAGPKVRALVQRYLDEQAPARTATTRRGSQDRLRYFLDFVQGDSLCAQDVLGYARFVQARSGRWGRPLSPFTRVAYLMAVQHFLRWATRSGYLLQDLAGLVVFKRPSSLPRPLSEDEMEALIERGPRDVRVRAILELLYGTGLRASELIRLTREDVDLEEGLLRVRLGKRQKDRVVPFGERVRQALLAYMQARARRRNPTLFLTRSGKPLSRELLLVLVVAAGERAGLVRRVSPHRLRHSFATHMLRNGAPLSALQRLLGHQSVRSTEAYLDVEVQDLGRMLQKSHPRERCKE